MKREIEEKLNERERESMDVREISRERERESIEAIYLYCCLWLDVYGAQLCAQLCGC